MQELALYDRPGWYDALHAEGTASWCDFLLALGKRHGTGGKRWLEPASSAGLRVEAAYSPWRKPITPDASTRDAFFVLR